MRSGRVAVSGWWWFGIALATCGCQAFVPEVGGEGQPCAEGVPADQACREAGLVCSTDNLCCRPLEPAARSCTPDRAAVVEDDGCQPPRTVDECNPDCRECQTDGDGAVACTPLPGKVHEGCSADARRRLEVDGCDMELAAIEVCQANAACALQPGGLVTTCACLDHWTGADCETCPEHFDATCTACTGNWDLSSGCSECVAHYTEASGCAECEAHFDLGSGCTSCLDHWQGASCVDCPENAVLPDCDECVYGYEGPGCAIAYCDTHDCWRVPPSGQATCYDETVQVASCPGQIESPDCGTTPLCGQDAQYPDPPRTLAGFERDGDRMVFDSATGLVWQVDFVRDTYQTFEAAVARCENLECGGFSDWRVADYHDWASLLSYYRFAPALDTNLFPTIGTNEWFSAMPRQPGTLTTVVCINADPGQLQWCSGATLTTVLCVRGGPAPVASSFTLEVVDGDVIATDDRTGLVWQADGICPEEGMTWAEALAHCEGLTYAGANDWRLPDVKELTSIIDPSRRRPASALSSVHPTCWLRTSTTMVSNPDLALLVNTADGWASGEAYKVARLLGDGSPAGALCVRAGR